MYSSKILRNAAMILLLSVMFYTFQGCKKNDVKPQSPYYFTADVNGTPWQANAEEAVDTTGAKGLLGIMIKGQDTSMMMIMLNDQVNFSVPVPINNESSFADSTVTAIVIYIGNRKDTSTYYVTPVTQEDAGTITTAQMDTANQIVSGTFHATATNENGDMKTITNGRFKMHITSSFSQFARNLMKDFGF